ncbi:MAG: autotransporter outer membrane beta-barrel domain-containing protein [Helicobacter sp.]|nr:autotransporter outer membrane beta-barrel domain-containing protein [Helicobacter sp.]
MALLGAQLNAAEPIVIDSQDKFEKYFQRDNETGWEYKANGDTTIHFTSDDAFNGVKAGYDIWIDTYNTSELTLKDPYSAGGCDINQSGECSSHIAVYNLGVGGDILYDGNGNILTTTKVENLVLSYDLPNEFYSNLEIKDSEVFIKGHSEGTIQVFADLEISGPEINHFNNGYIKVKGDANITNSAFHLIKTSFTALEANNLTLIEAKSFNSNVADNKIRALKPVYLKDYISDSALLREVDANRTDARNLLGLTMDELVDLSDINGKQLVEYELKAENGKLIANGGATEEAFKIENQIAFDKTAIESLIDEIQDSDDFSDELKTNLVANLNEAKDKLDAIANPSDDRAYINAVTGGLNNEDMTAALALRGIADLLGSFGADLMSREGIQLAIDIKNDTQESGKNTSNLTQATDTTISVANDMSIGSRIAMQNNPYHYAAKLSKLKLASVASDVAPNYLDNTYAQSVWANVFGGANIIDSNSGGLYGISVGADKYITDSVLLGVYFSYANSTLKDSSFKQESDNYQLGIYSNIHLDSLWELNLKGYGQISPMDSNYVQTDGAYKNDYTSKFLGLSANVGRKLELEDTSLVIKPFVGANYYFSYIPSHTDKGLIDKKMESSKNNSLSLEVGAEFRKYFNESSYFFAIPKVEQYVLNSSDDYNVTLAANNAFFTQVRTDDKKKTYGGLIIGGNMNLTEQLSLNVGVGAKQILAGKIDSKNETYLTGQAGLKYKF